MLCTVRTVILVESLHYTDEPEQDLQHQLPGAYLGIVRHFLVLT